MAKSHGQGGGVSVLIIVKPNKHYKDLLNWLFCRVRYQDAHVCGTVLSDDPGSCMFEQLLPSSGELICKQAFISKSHNGPAQ